MNNSDKLSFEDKHYELLEKIADEQKKQTSFLRILAIAAILWVLLAVLGNISAL